jgi:Flp pilus assembly protein TadD
MSHEGQRRFSDASTLAILAAVVCAVTLLAHWPALSANAQCFDDDDYLTENPLVQNPSWASARQLLTDVLKPATVKGYYHPLSTITIMLDSAMGGRPENRYVFNRTALILHVMNTVLVMILLQMLFDQPWAAAGAGLLFGVHPLTVEPIVWLGQRKALLAGTFVFWSLVLYVAYVRKQNPGLYALSILAFVLALLSKPTSTPLPLLLLLLDYWPMARLNRRAILEKIPFFAVAAASAVLTIVSHAASSVVHLSSRTGAAGIALTVCAKLAFYLSKIIWPVGLSSHYMPPEPFSLSNPVVWAAVIAVGLIMLAVAVLLRWTPAPAAGMLFFLLSILPVLGIVEYGWVFAFDNYAYVPMVGLLVPVAWAMGLLCNRGAAPSGPRLRRGAVLLAVIGAAALEASATRAYLHCWRDTETLFRHMVALAPRAYRARNNLALALAADGRLDEAIAEYQQVLRVNPGYDLAQKNLADALAMKGRLDEATAHYVESLRLDPNQAGVHFKLAGVLAQRGDVDGAVAHFGAALRLKPDSPVVHYNLANLLLAQGRPEEAVLHFNEALRLRPDMAEAHNNLGVALLKQGRIEEAIRHYTEALRLKPDYINAQRNLAAARAELGK